MILHDQPAAEDGSGAFIGQRTARLRLPAAAGASGEICVSCYAGFLEPPPYLQTYRDPCRAQQELLTIRRDVNALRTELQRLAGIVAAEEPEPDSTPDRSTNHAAKALRQPAATLVDCAGDRVEQAVSHLLLATSTPIDLKREWDRTDQAVADLLRLLPQQADGELERLQSKKAAANELRHARRLQAEKERKAIRGLRRKSWWRMAFS